MPHRILIAPTVEPLDLTEIKQQLRIAHDAEDSLLLGYLTSARQLWEELAGRALVAQTIEMTQGSWDQGIGITLPVSPAISVQSIAYVDSQGIPQVVLATDYLLDTIVEPNRITLQYGKSWPTARWQPNAVTVTYTAGYCTPFTVDPVTNLLTLSGRAPVTGERVRLSCSGGTFPSPLRPTFDYYVVGATGLTCQLALAPGGPEIDIQSQGFGLYFIGVVPQPILNEIKLWAGDQYEGREGAAFQAPRLQLSRGYRLHGAQG